MKRKTITIKVTSDEYVGAYLSLFYDALGLSPREEQVLEIVIKYYTELKGKVEEPFLTELILSTDRRKSIRESLKMSGAQLNNIIAKLKERWIFGNEATLTIDPRLIPSKDVLFVFKIEDTVEEIHTNQEKEEEPEDTEVVDGELKTEVKTVN